MDCMLRSKLQFVMCCIRLSIQVVTWLKEKHQLIGCASNCCLDAFCVHLLRLRQRESLDKLPTDQLEIMEQSWGTDMGSGAAAVVELQVATVGSSSHNRKEPCYTTDGFAIVHPQAEL